MPSTGKASIASLRESGGGLDLAEAEHVCALWLAACGVGVFLGGVGV